ncbi:MAG: DUF2938 domain-containing protein [Myxococcota bacterium]
MEIAPSSLAAAVLLGIAATATMDLWNLFLLRAFAIPSLDYCLLGRWLLHMPGGTFRHTAIAKSSAKPHECGLGRLAHYAIGIGLAVAFVALSGGRALDSPQILPALAFGLVTVAFPFFVMQPCLGLGVASAKAPRPALARCKSLASHTVFGLGLYAPVEIARALFGS